MVIVLIIRMFLTTPNIYAMWGCLSPWADGRRLFRSIAVAIADGLHGVNGREPTIR